MFSQALIDSGRPRHCLNWEVWTFYLPSTCTTNSKTVLLLPRRTKKSTPSKFRYPKQIHIKVEREIYIGIIHRHYRGEIVFRALAIWQWSIAKIWFLIPCINDAQMLMFFLFASGFVVQGQALAWGVLPVPYLRRLPGGQAVRLQGRQDLLW